MSSQAASANREPLTYLVTGGAGFIGSHLCEVLLKRGDRVTVVDNLSTGRLSNIAHLIKHPRFEFARASVTDAVVLDRLTSSADVVVHLAAAVGVKLIVERPVHTLETNINGTEAVLKSALRYGCRVVIASTSEVYGKGSRVPFGEEDDVLLGASSKNRWAYAASKMVDEFLGLAYEREYGLPVVLIRFFNTVGPRQTGQYGMVLPNFAQQALSGSPITIFGDGLQSRCFCDVDDVVRAVVGLCDHDQAPGQVYNVGSTQEVTIKEAALRILERVGVTGDQAQARLKYVPYEAAYEAGFEDMRRRVPDISRVRELLGWEPRLTFDDTIQRILRYSNDVRPTHSPRSGTWR